MSYIAGITSFNPNIPRLKDNIASISVQVDCVLVVDNCSNNVNDIESLILSFRNVHLIKNSKNFGIAYSMNQIGKYALDNGYDWFLTLDQDSVCPPNMIYEFSKNIDDSVGIICPYIKNNSSFISQFNPFRHIKSQENLVSPYCEDVLYAVSSGQFINVKAWKEANGFWDFLFIDYVDQEFCFHLTKLGYRIIRNNTCELSHEPGIPVVILGRETAKQSAFREYHWARNSRIVYSLYPKEYTKACPCSPFVSTIKRIANVILVNEDVINKLNAIYLGVRDAYRWKKENTSKA